MKKHHLEMERLESRDVPSATPGLIGGTPKLGPSPGLADNVVALRGLYRAMIVQAGTGHGQGAANGRAIIIAGGIDNPTLHLPPGLVGNAQAHFGFLNPHEEHGFNLLPELSEKLSVEIAPILQRGAGL